MKNKIMNYAQACALVLAFICNIACKGQEKPNSSVPDKMVRTIKQDKQGNIWLASAQGMIRYDGKGFVNMSNIPPARFFSVLEDRKGNLWFASVGSGVYYYDGKSVKNFTVKEGLADNSVTNIYEDKSGNMWFGTGAGASRFDGSSFQNYKMSAASANSSDSVHQSVYLQQLPKESWMHNDVNGIIEDKTGKLWFATRGFTFIYDGETYTPVSNPDGKLFQNVRSIIKDQQGNIWLGGSDGLWCYNGNAFTNFSKRFVGSVYEDRKGNIWTSSEIGRNQNWVLSRYNGSSLSRTSPEVTEIAINDRMLFGILEASDESIWVGGFKGVYRYDGKTITDFKRKDLK
jgi:ligand-binding sensor domain-containing protein